MEIPEYGQVTLLLISSSIPEAIKTTTKLSVDSIKRKKVGGHKAWITFISLCMNVSIC